MQKPIQFSQCTAYAPEERALGKSNSHRCFAFLSAQTKAQQMRAQQSSGAEQSGWYRYDGDHPIGLKWGIHLEGQWRREPLIARWEQLLVRPGVDYKLSRGVLLILAYTYVRDRPHSGSTQISGWEPRYSINEEIQAKKQVAGFQLENIVRLQQTIAGDRALGQKDLPWHFFERVR